MITLNEQLISINAEKHMACWQQKLSLQNPNSILPFDAVSIVTEYEGKQAVDSDLSLHYQLNNQQWQQPHFKLKITLHRQITRPLYCTLFYFDAFDGYIGSDLLQGIWLTPNETEAWAFDANPIPASISETLLAQGINQTQDFIKLVVSEKELDLALFQQDGQTTKARGIRVRPKPEPYTDWMSKKIMITTISQKTK